MTTAVERTGTRSILTAVIALCVLTTGLVAAPVAGLTDVTEGSTDSAAGLTDGTATTTPTPNATDADGIATWVEREFQKLDPSRTDEALAPIGRAIDPEPGNEHALAIYERAIANPHGIRPQIANYLWEHADGTVTAADANAVADPDEDALVTHYERRIGTDPAENDTDGDRLLDGPETVESVFVEGHENPLPDADPLHKDVYVAQVKTNGTYADEVQGVNSAILDRWGARRYVDRLDDAPVTNPDGDPGIDAHMELLSFDVHYEVAGSADYWGEFWPDAQNHSLDDTRLFVAMPENETFELALGHENVVVIPERYGNAGLLDHETLHGFVGDLDEEIQDGNDTVHPAPEYGPFTIRNENISSELSRDGMLHLAADKYADDSSWRLPENYDQVLYELEADSVCQLGPQAVSWIADVPSRVVDGQFERRFSDMPSADLRSLDGACTRTRG